MLLGTLGSSLLGNISSDWCMNKKGQGIKRAGKGIVRAGYGNHSSQNKSINWIPHHPLTNFEK